MCSTMNRIPKSDHVNLVVFLIERLFDLLVRHREVHVRLDAATRHAHRLVRLEQTPQVGENDAVARARLDLLEVVQLRSQKASKATASMSSSVCGCMLSFMLICE